MKKRTSLQAETKEAIFHQSRTVPAFLYY